MVSKKKRIFIHLMVPVIVLVVGAGCAGGKRSTTGEITETIVTNADGSGISVTVEFLKGKGHNHPLMAIWLEDMDGRYIETLYVAESIGKGIFRHADRSKGHWMAGPVRRPAALPYWGHKRGVKADDGYYIPTPGDPVPDAITGPTPAGDFRLKAKTTDQPGKRFRVMLEINQSWDWNEYWTNNKYPDDIHYSTSSQPAVVYESVIDLDSGQMEFPMKPVGHSHYSGANGSLNPDLGTLTTALTIVGSVKVMVSSLTP